jgi:hypothetical protein
LVAVPCASAGTAEQVRRYFPLQHGNSWTYENLRWGGHATVSAVRERPGVFRLAGFPGAERLRVRWSGQALQAWDAEQTRWEALLRFGAVAGTSYRVDLPPDLWQDVRITVVSRSAVVRSEPLRRSFPGSVRLALRPRAGLADAGITSMAFAPRVGLVTWQEQSIAGPVAHALSAARVGRTTLGD